MKNINKPPINKIHPPTKDDLKELDAQINTGFLLLTEIDSRINRSSDPESIVNTIDIYSKNKRPKNNISQVKFDRKEILNFKTLDMVLGEQIVRRSKWKWFIYELREQILNYRNFILISADKKYKWHPFGGCVKYFSERNYNQEIDIKNYFDDINNVEIFIKKRIKTVLDFYREENSNYINKSDEKLLEILTKEKIEDYKTIPFYAIRYKKLLNKEIKNASDEEILKKFQEDIDRDIFSQLLPHSVNKLNENKTIEIHF